MTKISYKNTIIFLHMLLLSGCASITTGSNQSLSVNTEPESGANCELKNDKGTWYINSTPGSVVVNRSYSDLHIICKKDSRFGNSTVKSTIKGMAFGNIIAGGLIGAGIDVHTGAAYDYPATIFVYLK